MKPPTEPLSGFPMAPVQNKGRNNPLAWPRSMQLGLAFLLGILGILLVQHAWHRLKPGRPTTEVKPVVYIIDLNQASEAELMQLPGVGPRTAQSIVEHRRQRPFDTVDDLQAIRGIGPSLVEKIRHQAKARRTGPNEYESFNAGRVRQTRPTPHSIDLNTANKAELILLPGIGPAIAQRIIDDRETNGPFHQPSDVMRVKGIKAKKFESIRPYVIVDASPSIKLADL